MYFQELWSNSKHFVSDSFRSNVCLSPRIAEYQSRVSSSSEKQTEACSISVSSAIDEFLLRVQVAAEAVVCSRSVLMTQI